MNWDGAAEMANEDALLPGKTTKIIHEACRTFGLE